MNENTRLAYNQIGNRATIERCTSPDAIGSTELVFIGERTRLDKSALSRNFRSCLYQAGS